MSNSKLKKILTTDSFSIIFIIVFMLIFMLIYNPNYLSGDNVYSLMRVFAITAIIGFSQMIVMSTGGMNVAIGAIGGLCAVMSGIFMSSCGLPVWLTIILSLLLGVICGAVNGFFTLRVGGVGVASFLATLATSSVFAGITLTLTRGKPNYEIDPGFISLGSSMIFGIPSSIFIMVAITLLIWIMYRYSGLGKQMLAFGGNNRAAELYGVKKVNVILTAHILSGLLAAAAGMLTVMKIKAAQTNIGDDWMLASMAVPLLGGTRNSGGKVNVFGTILGAVVLSIIANSLVHMKVDVYWTTLINGIVILAVATIDMIRRSQKK